MAGSFVADRSTTWDSTSSASIRGVPAIASACGRPLNKRGEPFRETDAVRLRPGIGSLDRHGPVVVSLRVPLHDHAVDEHRLKEVEDGRLVAPPTFAEEVKAPPIFPSSFPG